MSEYIVGLISGFKHGFFGFLFFLKAKTTFIKLKILRYGLEEIAVCESWFHTSSCRGWPRDEIRSCCCHCFFLTAAFISASLAISRKPVLQYLRIAQLSCLSSWEKGTIISWQPVHFSQEKTIWKFLSTQLLSSKLCIFTFYSLYALQLKVMQICQSSYAWSPFESGTALLEFQRYNPSISPPVPLNTT